MEFDPPGLRSSRVKACTECRQQKLRCDAAQSTSTGCTRCRKRGLKCVITTNFVRTKRKTKSELQAELEALKERQLQNTAHISPDQQSTFTVPAYNTAPSLPTPSNQSNDSRHNAEVFQQTVPNFSAIPALDNAISPTLSRTIGDLVIAAPSIEDCFQIFYSRYLPQLPALEIELAPNDCYEQSAYLFWIIVTIGSRRYHGDPTLLPQLVPQVTELTQHAAFSREKSLHTISAFMLLSTWPLPYNSMSKDLSHILSGVLLQHCLGVGLHIFGVGQDFSRVKLQQDLGQMYFRARLWVLCIVICQRISCTEGMPPVSVPDNYDHDSQQAQSVYALPPALRFQKTLSRILTESVLELERYALSKTMQQRATVLNPIIDAALLSLAELEPECPTEIDRYYLTCAELQITTFHLLGPKEFYDNSKLARMHELSCKAIEILDVLNKAQSWAEDAPATALKYLNLAGFTLLKLSRCHIRESLDLNRGKTAYFTAISIFRRAAIDGEDIFSRSGKILTQLWTSKQIFTKTDGTTDALTLRCGSRLAMSIMYDCLWWWRSEFAGLPNPYEEKDHNVDNLTPGTLQNMAWLQEAFPEFAWPTTQDMVSFDWVPQPAAPNPSPAPKSAVPDPGTIWL